jgi:hypothetical protein
MRGNYDWRSSNCPIGYDVGYFPSVDQVSLGQAFDPDSPPPFWLIEMSALLSGLELWESLRIESSTMMGWWEGQVAIKTNNSDAFATVFCKESECLRAIAT